MDSVYAGVVSMPNPKTSGTGYNFLKSLVNAWGEDAAFDYFDALAENVYQFTSSGSGPVNALVQGERSSWAWHDLSRGIRDKRGCSTLRPLL